MVPTCAIEAPKPREHGKEGQPRAPMMKRQSVGAIELASETTEKHGSRALRGTVSHPLRPSNPRLLRLPVQTAAQVYRRALRGAAQRRRPGRDQPHTGANEDE